MNFGFEQKISPEPTILFVGRYILTLHSLNCSQSVLECGVRILAPPWQGIESRAYLQHLATDLLEQDTSWDTNSVGVVI